MRPVAIELPAQRTALITRAVGAAWPLQALVTALWLAVPHGAGAHEAWVVALTLAMAPVHLPLLLPRPPAISGVGLNVASALGIAEMCALVWAGGGLMSGFELLTLWFLPITVCALPRRDIAAHIALVVAGCPVAVVLGGSAGGHDAVGNLWGFAVVAVATVVVNTGMVGFLYGRLRATTEDYQRRSVEDALTGLANRALLHERLDELDVTAPRAVYVIDVDGFKFVNDSLGHHAGDRLLALVAERLAHHARQGDLLARPGGDEFVLVADGIPDDEAALALG